MSSIRKRGNKYQVQVRVQGQKITKSFNKLIHAISQLINEMKDELQKKDKSIKGFNIGNNSGEVAGQTIFHCHIHLIPRRKNDVDDPRGGVRGVIPEKQKY